MIRRISIPAAYAGCDPHAAIVSKCRGFISIPAAYAGCDSACPASCGCSADFNPRSLCRLRRRVSSDLIARLNFNPRSLCRLRREHFDPFEARQDFNPRSLCRLRPRLRPFLPRLSYFNPRSLCRLRRVERRRRGDHKHISIPAAYAGCDTYPCSARWSATNFNPRSLCRLRLEL